MESQWEEEDVPGEGGSVVTEGSDEGLIVLFSAGQGGDLAELSDEMIRKHGETVRVDNGGPSKPDRAFWT